MEYLIFAGKLFGLSKNLIAKRAGELLENVGLSGKEKTRLRSFSRGMLQRLGMAQALIHDPEILILDEPMTGLDPIGRKEFRDLILALKQNGKTIFFSSHILADAEMISDRVGILRQGCLVREMQLHEIQSKDALGMEIVFRKPVDKEIKDEDAPWSMEIFEHGGMINVEDESAVFKAVDWVKETGGSIVSISPRRKTLEDIFIEEVQN
jgi:ABC-2 type transport system ATP-binding protein